MPYVMPRMKSVSVEDIYWHASKLAEETGEVCQIICKNGISDPVDLAHECLDVIQCAENILRNIGITTEMYDNVMIEHLYKQKNRGYIDDDKELSCLNLIG